MAEGNDNVIYLGIVDCSRGNHAQPAVRQAAYDMLRAMAAPLAGRPPSDLDLAVDPSGKPRFARYPDIHFNLSHSGPLAACAVGPVPLGVDIEVLRERPFWPEIAAAMFSAEERDFLKTRENDGALAAFYHLWTRKEAWLKLQGRSVWHIGQAPSGDNDTEILTWRGTGAVSFSLSLCTPTGPEPLLPVRFHTEFHPRELTIRAIDPVSLQDAL